MAGKQENSVAFCVTAAYVLHNTKRSKKIPWFHPAHITDQFVYTTVSGEMKTPNTADCIHCKPPLYIVCEGFVSLHQKRNETAIRWNRWSGRVLSRKLTVEISICARMDYTLDKYSTSLEYWAVVRLAIVT